MRIWSLHPKYLDSKGLVALWRETLLAKHVLEGKTKGYKNHPQLSRFKKSKKPLDCINHYLSVVLEEAQRRDYNFDEHKIGAFAPARLRVTKGQLNFERTHLLKKLWVRDRQKYAVLKKTSTCEPHSMLTAMPGEIEEWEILKRS